MNAISVDAEDRFAVIPEWVLYADVSAQAVRLYAVLRRKADNETGASFYSRRTLAGLLRVKDPKVVDRTVAELEAIGAVKVTRGRLSEHGDPTTNLYTVRTSRPRGVVVEKPLPRGRKATRGSGENATTVVAEKGDELRATELRATSNSQNPPSPRERGAVDNPSRCRKHVRPKAYCTDCQTPPPAPPPAWCGDCDPQGERDVGARMVSVIDDEGVERWGLCPRCHPGHPDALRRTA
jgi:hypothetical protein